MIEFEMWKDVFDLDNPLTLEYFEICSKDTEETIYKDKHHILPRAMFKQFIKSKWNIVKLSYQDHYRAHEILPQICLQTNHKHKMIRAWHLTLHTKEGLIVTKEEYEALKMLFRDAQSIAQKNRTLSAVTRSKIGDRHRGEKNHFYGKPMTASRKAKMVASKSLKESEFVERLKQQSTFTLVKGYTAMSKLAWFQCENKHPPFQMTPTHVMEGRICPHCFQDIVKQREVAFRQWLQDNTDLKLISDFSGMTSDAWFQCSKEHAPFKTRPSYLQRPPTDDKKHGPTGCKWCRKEQRKLRDAAKKLAAQQVTNND